MVGAHQLPGKGVRASTPRKGSECINYQERRVRIAKKRKGIGALRVKPPTPSLGIDALIGDEEQNGKQKQEKKETERVPSPATLNHSVALLRPAGFMW